MSAESPGSPCVKFLNERESDCIHCGLRGSALFASLKPSMLDDELKAIHNGIVRPDAVIYRQGDPADAVFTIRSGLVKLVYVNESQEIVRLLGRGAAIGLEAATDAHYEHSAIAMRDLNLCRIPSSLLGSLEQRSPPLLKGLAAKWREHATLSDLWISSICRGKQQDRVPALIRFIIKVSGDPPTAVRLPHTAEMAAILGCSTTYVSRFMATLKRKGMLHRIGPWTYRCGPELIESPQGRRW